MTPLGTRAQRACPIGSDHTTDLQGAVLDGADLENVTGAGDEVADRPRPFLGREVADRLAVLGDELVAKDACHRPLHDGHPSVTR
jgi:hypothetical protein